MEATASAGVLTFDDVDFLAAPTSETILGRLLRTRGLAGPDAAERPEAPAGAGVAAPRVLLVEDDPEMLDILRARLGRRGYGVVAAGSGDEALIEFARTPFSVVVTDLAMPGVNGLELARRCKQARPDVTVVMVTAWERLLTDEDLARHGVDHLLAKPVDFDALLDTLHRATRRG